MKNITRRTVIKAAAGAALIPSAIRAAKRDLRPNILFIMADDLGFADLSCYGRRDYKTPALDGLARQGMRFTNAYANSAVCSATRTALITGRYQYRLPVGLEEPLAMRPIGLEASEPTLPSLLRGAGYSTSLIGKWHLGALPKFSPNKSGYDHFWGIRGGGVDYFTHAMAGRSDLWDDDVAVEQAGYLTDLIADRAIKQLGENAKAAKPFLMSLHFTAPHWPWESPGDAAEAERLAQQKSPFAIMHHDGGSMKTYAEMVTRMDYQIGRVLAELKRLGLSQNTIVVFTSDNGGERFSDTYPLSGRKSELLEGGIRVPTIVRWPGRVKPGSTSAAHVMTMDWMPTFLGAASVAGSPAKPSDGIDLRAVFSGGTLNDRPLFWRYKGLSQQAMRQGDWKYLKVGDNRFLFNLADDPMERANLKARQPVRFAAMIAQYDSWNATMLPIDPGTQIFLHGNDTWADRMGIDPVPVPPMTPNP
jgi:arylsulfatase A-like enzyme